jgi:hypothetical protein
MDQLEPLYDPTVGADGQPQVVHFCANLQGFFHKLIIHYIKHCVSEFIVFVIAPENLLRQLDPPLCEHLENSFIQSQIYGMRWARLLLGREFQCSDTQTLRIWDYIFAGCAAPHIGAEKGLHDELPDPEVIFFHKL